MADITDLVEYYTNLLILQYNGLPNASATISLLAETIFASGVAIDVQNAYNIDSSLGDTAVGAQLDVIGKYVGINRYFAAVNYGDYFAMVTYSEHAALPTSPPAFGFEKYSTFINDFDYNGTLVYDDIITSQNALSDASFLTLIQLAILRNNMNFSDQAIDEAMWGLFAGTIRPEEGSYTMNMYYFIQGSETTLIQAMIDKDLLPKPMGVGMGIITGINGLMFSFVSYSAETSPFGYGYSTYSNYATLVGTDLIYSMIQEQ